jgi:hypothetical protein
MSSIDDDLTKLAVSTAHDLGKRIGIDAVFVMVVSKGADRSGFAMFSPTLPVDTVIAMAVDGLGSIRQKTIALLQARLDEEKEKKP